MSVAIVSKGPVMKIFVFKYFLHSLMFKKLKFFNIRA